LSLPREVGVALDAAVREILGGTERQGSSVQSDPSRCLVTVDDGSGSGWGLHRRRINSVTAWLRNSGYAALCSRQGTTAGFGDAATAILVPATSAPGCGNTVLHCSTSGGSATSKDLVISNASFLFNKDLDRPADAAVQAFHSDAFTSADTEFVAGNFQARTLLRCVQRAQQQRDPLLQFVGDIAEYFPPVTSNPSVRTAVLIQLDATWESLKLLASMGGQITELPQQLRDAIRRHQPANTSGYNCRSLLVLHRTADAKRVMIVRYTFFAGLYGLLVCFGGRLWHAGDTTAGVSPVPPGGPLSGGPVSGGPDSGGRDLSPSPFRKLQIAESEYGLQNFTESGYGFRIYGIEVDMYRISRGIIFFLGNRRFDTYGFHGFTDSVRIARPCQKRSSANLQTSTPRRAPLSRAGYVAGALVWRGGPLSFKKIMRLP
jgi:hypothetical protein